jgi:hypothetical protein
MPGLDPGISPQLAQDRRVKPGDDAFEEAGYGSRQSAQWFKRGSVMQSRLQP